MSFLESYSLSPHETGCWAGRGDAGRGVSRKSRDVHGGHTYILTHERLQLHRRRYEKKRHTAGDADNSLVGILVVPTTTSVATVFPVKHTVLQRHYCSRTRNHREPISNYIRLAGFP